MRRFVIAAASCALAAACSQTIHGVVYVDRNGDRVRQDDEPGLAGVVVAHDAEAFVVTDEEGRYRLDVLAAEGIVWVRSPAGYRPGPTWRRAGDVIDLGVIPLPTADLETPLAFVVGADTHATTSTGPWNGGDLADAIDQAVSLPSPPRFFTIVGDVTQANNADEFGRVDDALGGVSVPWVPVPGNHDWYDGGRAWRGHWGPDNYSFDVDDVHVIVWDTNLSVEQQLAFFTADLAFVPLDMTVVALGHDSPTDETAAQLAALGVDYLFTGHWHANRRVERTGLVEWGTQTMVMGSIDQSPAGYRVVTFHGGTPTVEHRARLVAPHLDVAQPHAGSCAPATGGELLVSAAFDASIPRVTARVDCGPEIELTARGGWSFGVDLPALAAGAHRIDVRAESAAGRGLDAAVQFEVCDRSSATRTPADWPQVGGGPAHASATATPIVPPLQQLWATAIGGNVLLGSPVVKDGTIVVATWDLGSGDTGGVVALDLATGAIRWRATTAYQARSAPAIDGDTVVVGLANGEVHAYGLADGAPRWSHDASEGLSTRAGSLWASPTIVGGVVYVAVQGRMSALDLATGEVIWANELAPEYPWLGTLAAVTAAGNTTLANYGRQQGMTAWNATTGAKQWEIRSPRTTAVNATPVVDGNTVYVINSSGEVSAIDLQTSAPQWMTAVTPDSSDWMYSVTAAPAVAGGRLFVPTQWRDLVALDTASGAELWRATAPGGPLQFAHYRADEPGFAASPVVTGDLVWVPRPDGSLAALAASDGRELWSTQLGAPLVSAPAPAGDYLVVASFDGTVRALASAPAVTPSAELPACEPLTPTDEPPPPAGCCETGGRSPTVLALAFIVALVLGRRRRATS